MIYAKRETDKHYIFISSYHQNTYDRMELETRIEPGITIGIIFRNTVLAIGSAKFNK